MGSMAVENTEYFTFIWNLVLEIYILVLHVVVVSDAHSWYADCIHLGQWIFEYVLLFLWFLLLFDLTFWLCYWFVLNVELIEFESGRFGGGLKILFEELIDKFHGFGGVGWFIDILTGYRFLLENIVAFDLYVLIKW